MKKKTTLSYIVKLFKDNELFRQNYVEKIDTTIKQNHSKEVMFLKVGDW